MGESGKVGERGKEGKSISEFGRNVRKNEERQTETERKERERRMAD